MPISRYDHYGKPRLLVGPKGVYLIRDIYTEEGRFAGMCENGYYDEAYGEVMWNICREGESFENLRPFMLDEQVQIEVEALAREQVE